ncbi:MAG: polysaccharide deacetylase family protein [Parcubacteria group bacterium]
MLSVTKALLLPIHQDPFSDQIHVFLQLRGEEAPTDPGMWAFFGGGVEEGESAEQACRRETKEELDIEIETRDLMAVSFRHLTIFLYPIAKLTEFEQKVTVLEGDDGRWWPAADLPPNVSLTDRVALALATRKFAQERVNLFLSIDVEEPWHVNFNGRSVFSYFADRKTSIPQTIDQVLLLLEGKGLKATFFIVGEVAEKYPEMVKAIASYGHEIASHSYQHGLIYLMDRREFRADVRRSKEVLESISGRKVIGFRPPSWSFPREKDPRRLQVLYQILKEEDYHYSSGIYSGFTQLYGTLTKSSGPHLIETAAGTIWEFPVPLLTVLGPLKVGFSGGVFLRALLWALSAYAVRTLIAARMDRDRYGMVYLHPREMQTHFSDSGINLAELWLNPLDRLIYSLGQKNMPPKVEYLIDRLGGMCFRDYLEAEALL